jgi:hypothetical protein
MKLAWDGMNEFDEPDEFHEPRSGFFRLLDIAAVIGLVLAFLLIYASPITAVVIIIVAVRLWSNDRISLVQCLALAVFSVIVSLVSLSGLATRDGATAPAIKPGTVVVPINLR